MPFTKFHQHSSTEILKTLLTSIVAYVFLLFAAYELSQYSYYWVLALAIPTHFFHARMFVVMHDCGHFSFIKSRSLNNLVGHITAFFFYTPFLMWRELHNKHHRYQGNLDRRDQSLDVWTMTTEEFKKTAALKRTVYRIYRHPVFLFSVAPVFLFLLIFRVPFESFSKKAVINIIFLDLVLLVLMFGFPGFFVQFIFVQAPSLLLGFGMASYLFYIQHQFEGTLWLRDDDFKNSLIAEHGSSYFKLPPFLNWVYGNIGYHHLHHFDVKIPMYNLPQAQVQYGVEPTAVTLKNSLKCLKLRLWDESSRKMVGFP